MKRKKQLTPWRLGVIGLLMVVFFGLTQLKLNSVKAISYDVDNNGWCASDLKTTLNDASTGFLSNLGSWATYVLTVPWTVGNNTNESSTTCSSKIATFSYAEWNAIKSTYRTAINGSDSGNYFASGITNAWTRTPSATAGYAYQAAASGGALSTATVATDNSVLPGLYLDTTQICLSNFYGENGSNSDPYSIVLGSNCDAAPTITINNASTAIALNANSSAGLTISGTATDYDGGQTLTISATVAGTTKSTTINILATATVNWSLTWSLAELTNGIYTGNKVFTVTDSASKTGTANYTGTITVDKTAPSVAATSPAYPNNATLTLTDNLGVKYWAVTTSSTAPSTTAAGTNVTNITSTGLGSWQPITQGTSKTATFTPAATGTYYAWVKDVSGNTASVTFSVTNGVFSGAATITGSLYVSASLTSGNTISPVGTYTYQWYRNSTSSTSGAAAISGATSSSYTLTTSDVSKYVYVVISATKTYYTTKTFTSNILGPINGLPTLVLTPSSGYTRSGSTTTSTISGTNYGTLSCVSSNTAAATCSINGTTLTITGGSTSATATITVTEANMSVQATYTVINDVVAPTGMAVSCPGTYSGTGNYVVTQTGTITDSGGSGVNNSTKFFQVKSGSLSNGVCNFGAATFVDTGDVGVNSLTQNPMPAGCYVYRYRTSDNSGNAGYSSTCQVMVGDPPTCSVALTGTQGSNSWYTGTLTGALTTSSPYFGLSYYDIATSYISSSTNTKTTTTNTADGTNLYFYGYAQDTVGQISRCTSIVYKKDGTAPTASATTAIYGGTSTLTLADATSGVSYWAVTTSSTAPSTTAAGTNVTSITSTGLNTWQPITNGTSKTATFTNSGAGTYYAWAKDDAGNVSAAGSFTITQATGHVTLSATSGSVTYGTASSTFTVASSHGGTLSVAETTSTAATVSIASSTVTLATLGTLAAGTTVTVRVTSAATTNYTSAYADYTLTITKATPTVSLTAKSATYTGSAIAANTATVTPATGGAVTYLYYTNSACSTQTTTSDGSGAASSGAAPVNVGSYYVKATVASTTNYNSASSACVAHTITKATGYVTLSATSGSVTYGTANSTFSVASSHGGTLSVAETTSTAATESISGTTVTMATLSGLSAGTTVTIRVTSAATTNYTSAYADYTLTITNASFSGGSVTITGTNKVGATLTAAVTNTTPVATYAYQWYSHTSNATTGGTAISGATSSTYVVDASLVGKYIYVVVTATKASYNTITFADITDASNNGSATVLLEPTITTQPVAKIVGPYTSANLFSVTTSGTNLSYQWYYATTIDGAGTAINATNDPQLQNFTTATLATKFHYLYNNSTGPNYNGYYFYCVVSNDVGSATSDRAQLTVVTAPTITTQPIDTTSYVGSNATFTTVATAGNVAGVNYQWQKPTGSNTPTISLGGSYGTDGTGTYLTKNTANTNSGTITLASVPVTPGKTYTWSVELYSTTAHTIYKDTNITDASGWKYRGNDSAHSSVVVTPTATVANEWTTFTITSTVAADALYPVYQHYFYLLDMTEGEKVYYQNNTLTSSDGGVIWTDIAGATSASYTLSSLTADLDETIYRARIYNSYATTGTNVVTLNVNSLATAPTCNSATYNGSSQTLLNSGTGYILSGNYSGTNAGSYTATATLADNYQWTNGTTTAKSITCSIAKATPTVSLTAKSATYTGSAIAANTATVTPATGGAVTYLYYTNSACSTQTTTSDGSGAASSGAAPVNVGSYYVKATVASTTNYNSASSACTAHTITAASFTPVVSMTGYTYGGTQTSPSISGNTSGGTVTYYYNTSNSNSGGTLWSSVTSSTYLAAGTYYMYATVAATANYNSATSATASFVIAKATPTVSLTAKSATYTGSAIAANTATVTPTTGGAVTYLYYSDNTCTTQTTTADGSGAASSGAAPVNVGSYYVKATVASTTNYNSASSACTAHTITLAAIATTGTCPTLTYNGSSQTLASGAANATYTSNTGINAGAYTVTVTANTNYTFSDGTTSKTLSCSIATKSIAVTWGETTSFVYNGSAQGPTASAVSGVTGETLNISRTTAVNVGSYTSTATLNTVTGGQALVSNYILTGNTKAFVITQTVPTVSVTITGTPTTGNTLTANVTTSSDGAKTYQWWTATTAGATSGTAISGATGNTFAVTNAQAGLYIGVTVTVAQTTNYASASGTAITASKAQGIFTGSVSINGTVTYGETLTVNTTGITPTGSYAYQWYSNTTESTTGGTAISGATASSYVIGSGLVEKYIYVVVTASATDYVSQNFAAVTTTTVIKGTPTISLTAKTATYNGLGIAANSATANYLGNSVSLSYNYAYYSGDSCQGETLENIPVSAGIYSVIATSNATSNLNSASSSCTAHTITSAATATTGSCASLTYDGSNQTLASGASNATYSNNAAINAGSHTVTITANTNYTFSDGTTSKTLSCSITTKSIAITWGETTSFVYNGSAQGPTASANSGIAGETLNISSTKATNVGSQTSTATLDSVTGGQALVSNYTLTGNTKVFTITQAATSVSLTAKTATYTGSAIAANTATVSPVVAGTFTYIYYSNNACGTQTTTSDGSGAAATGAAPKNVGVYYVKATFTPTSGNYAGSSSTCTAHTITLSATATTGSCASLTYNGSSQTLASGASNATYSNNAAINAGSYTVTVTANANYSFSDGETSKTLSCSMAKKTATVTAGSANRLYDGTPLTENSCTFTGGVSGHTATCTMTTASTITTVGTTSNVIETAIIKDGGAVDVTDNYTLTKVNGTLTINDSEIVITTQPANLNVNEEISGSFSVVATGSNLVYQWYVNSSNSTTGGTVISGATAATYTISAENMTSALNGKYYYVTIHNSTYTQTSNTALLTVYGKPAPAPTIVASDGIASGNWHKTDFTLGISGSTITGAGAVGYLYGTTTMPTTEGNSISINTETAGTNYYAQAYNTLATTLKSDVSAVYIAKLDKTTPVGAGITCPGGYSTTGNYTVNGTTGTDSDGSGIATSLSYFQVRTGALVNGVCNYGSNNFVNTGSAGSETLVQNPMPTGCYTYRYIISDNAGNTNTSTTCQVLVDNNAPSAPRVTITDDDENEIGTIEGGETAGNCNTTGITIYSASASANLNFSGSSDAETGISGYAWSTSTSGPKTEATSLVATATTTGTTYFIYAKDVAGNYSTCYTKVTVKLVTLTLTPNSGVSYVEGENLTATISGNNYGTLSCQSSDASKATCSIEGTTLTITPVAEGTATITVTETNTNASVVYTAVIWDQPSCTISENPTSWAQSAVLTVSSNNSNLASAPFSWETATTGFSQTATKTITTNDTYTAWVKNDLGLTNSCEITVSNIDTTMPVVLATDDVIYTNQTPITTRIYNVNDTASGIASVNWNLWIGSTKLVDGVTGSNTGSTYYKNFDFSSLTEGYYTVTGTVTDQAGNAYAWNDNLGAIGIYYDTTAPVGGGVTIETTNINLNTNSVDLEVDDGTDNLSGLDLTSRNLTTRTGVLTNGECGEYSSWTNQSYTGTYPNLTLETNYTGDRCYQYRWSVTDKAGNTTNYTSEEIKVLAVIVPELTVTPPDASASAAQDIYVTATVATGSVTRIAYLWDGDLNASCNNGHTIVSGVNLKATQPDGSHVLNVCAISDTNGVATYSDTYGYSATPIIPTLQYQNSAANLYWNGVALNPLSENLTIVGAYAKTGKVYHYRLTLEIQDNNELVTTDEVTVTTSTTGEVLFQFVIPISELNSGKENSSLMGPQKVTVTDLDTNESITFDYNVSFYFPAYQLDYEANAGNYIMMIGAGAANKIATLQNFSAADCSAWTSVTGDDYSNAYGKKSDNLYLSAYYLRDNRDGKLYEVRKFSDGNCWLVDNLAYGGGTDGESDYCAAKTTMRAATTVEETTATITNGLNAVTGTPTLVGDCRNNPSNKDYGYLYNWAAAIQKTSGYDGLDYTPPQPITGLCPAGWVLPTGGNTSDFSALAAAVATDEFFLPGGNFKGIYAGMTETGESVGNLTGQGTKQNYWSSTKNTASEAYVLHIQSTETKIQAFNVANKQAGRAIRCVKKAN